MTAPSARRRSRVWLYVPFILLAVAAAAWSGFWFMVQGRVTEAVDRALARETQQGRDWACADRSVTGFPFRIELRCSSLVLTSSRWGDAVRVQTGPAVAVGQIYTPGLVILQVSGPMQAKLPQERMLDLGWASFEASLAHQDGVPQRLSLALADPKATLTAPGEPSQSWSAAAFEAHLRRSPTRPAAEQAVDIALNARGAVVPVLDAILGTGEPGDLALESVVTQAEAFRNGFNPQTLEAWRTASGQLELTRLSTTKGPARVEAAGRFLIDETRRPAGQIQASLAGIKQIAGLPVGGLMGGLGGLLGGRLSAQLPGAAPGLTPLPPVVLREGRVYLGPIRLPVQPLAALY